MKTKLFLFAALAAATVLTSCSKDDEDTKSPVSQVAGNEIKFQVGIDNSHGTRVIPVTSANFGSQMKEFNVYIQNAVDGSAFAGSLASPLKYVNGGNGSFAPAAGVGTYFWPTTALSFYAYSYDPDKGSNISMSDNIVNYDVSSTNYIQTDLMYASNKNVTKDANNGIVSLQFKHALAQINFKAGSVLKDHEVDINDVTISGLPGKVSVNLLTGTVTSSGNGAYTMVCGNSKEENAVAVLRSGSTASPISGEDASWLGTSLLVPPCSNMTEWEPVNDLSDGYITVSCKIRNTKTGKYIVGSETSFSNINLPFSAVFKSGMSYNIVLNFNGENGFGYDDDGNDVTNLISYKIGVSEWQNGTGSSIDY